MATRGLIDKTSDRRWAVWHLADDEPSDTQQQLDLGQTPERSSRRDRQAEVRILLANGSQSTKELATAMDLTPQAVLQWLHRLEGVGRVRPTSTNRRSPKNRWELIKVR